MALKMGRKNSNHKDISLVYGMLIAKYERSLCKLFFQTIFWAFILERKNLKKWVAASVLA